jgi:hypothetical protein
LQQHGNRKDAPVKKIHLRAALTLPLLALGAWLAVGCEDEPDDSGDGYVCHPGDPVEGLTCECRADECVCPSAGDCAILCVEACDLQCAGSGSCDFACATGCDVSCTGSGNCALSIATGSTVACTGSGDCAVDCDGDCAISCPGSATCTVRCEPGFACTLESCPSEVHECPGDILVCNGGCP